MRTTLAIDDDVLIAAKAMARQQQKSIGEIVSELARTALRRPEAPRSRNGMMLLPRAADQGVVTLDMINALRDDAG